VRRRAVVLAGASASALAACLRGLPAVDAVVVVTVAAGRFVAAEGARLADLPAAVLVLPDDLGLGAAALAGSLYRAQEPSEIAVIVAGEPLGELPAAVLDEATRAARGGAWVDLIGGPSVALVSVGNLLATEAADAVRASLAAVEVDPDFSRIPRLPWSQVAPLDLPDLRPAVRVAIGRPPPSQPQDPASGLDPAVVDRPWGSFQPLAAGPRYKVKRIIVEVGGSLSLQRHQHRAEHWVVVRGRARVVRGRRELELGERASTFIPRGVVHRLENAGDTPLEVIEVQTGDRVEEGDIERLEDRYGRAGRGW